MESDERTPLFTNTYVPRERNDALPNGGVDFS